MHVYGRIGEGCRGNWSISSFIIVFLYKAHVYFAIKAANKNDTKTGQEISRQKQCSLHYQL